MMPQKRMLKRKKNRSKSKCDGCKKIIRMRHIVKFKGRFLCYVCRQKLLTQRLQESASDKLSDRLKITLKEALEKTYMIHGYLTKKGSIIAQRTFPSILVGHKVKLVLVK